MNLGPEPMDDIGQIVDDSREKLAFDRRISIAKAHAMLSVAQELSRLGLQNSGSLVKDG